MCSQSPTSNSGQHYEMKVKTKRNSIRIVPLIFNLELFTKYQAFE